MNVSSSNVLDGSTGTKGTTHITIITVSVLLSAAALCILALVLYMAIKTNKKRAGDRPPAPDNEASDDKLRQIRLSLAFGDMEPKVQRELVTMRTDNYDVKGSNPNKDGQGVKKLPLKCHL